MPLPSSCQAGNAQGSEGKYDHYAPQGAKWEFIGVQAGGGGIPIDPPDYLFEQKSVGGSTEERANNFPVNPSERPGRRSQKNIKRVGVFDQPKKKK